MKTKSNNFILAAKTDWEQVGEGISRQIMGYDGQLMLVKIKFEKGAIGYLHQHFHSQSSYVVSGKFEVVINDVKQILEAGDGFLCSTRRATWSRVPRKRNIDRCF